jgi:hypothetical protein
MAQGVGESGQDGTGGEGGEKVAELLTFLTSLAPTGSRRAAGLPGDQKPTFHSSTIAKYHSQRRKSANQTPPLQLKHEYPSKQSTTLCLNYRRFDVFISRIFGSIRNMCMRR